MENSLRLPQQTNPAAEPSPSPVLSAYPILLTEDELIDLLRIRETGSTANPYNVIVNLKRMHGLPCIHICKTPLYPLEAVRQWILDKVQKEQR
jgi:hypothetical protein